MPDSHNELMAAIWTERQRLIRTIAIVSTVILALDIILLNVLDEAVGDWWTLLVGFGVFVVGTVAVVSLVWLLVDRSRTA